WRGRRDRESGRSRDRAHRGPRPKPAGRRGADGRPSAHGDGHGFHADVPRLTRSHAPSGIRTRATALKGPRPGPLVDGGGYLDSTLSLRASDARGPVAQLVEQGTFNPKVAGSIPARPK